MKYTYEEISKDTARITECIGKEQEIVLPEKIDGKAVTEIAAYLFSPHKDRRRSEEVDGKELKSISLSPAIRRLGNYALYGCSKLSKLSFTDSLQDIGGGTFTGCYPKELKIEFWEGEASVLKDILSEVHQAVEVTLCYLEGERTKTAVLTFPQYYEEAVENTPARLLSTRFHGSGGDYRQCFQGKAVNYKEYDTLFPIAKAREEVITVYRMAYNRLRCPYRLSKDAKEMYQTYLVEKGELIMGEIIRAEDMKLLVFLTEQKYWSEAGLEAALQESVLQSKTLCTGYQ